MTSTIERWSWAFVVLRCGLALLFILAGASKLYEPALFADLVTRLGVLGPLQPAVVRFLPALELAAGLLLLFDRDPGLHLVTGLLLLFVVVLAFAIARGIDIGCACFYLGGASGIFKSGLAETLRRDLLLLLVCAGLYLERRRPAVGGATTNQPAG